MNRLRKSGKKCRRQEEEKKLFDADEAPGTKTMKVEIENGGSPPRSCDMRVSSHSTPISKRDCSFNMEDSPELDYRCSPIFLPCTQDGGNEIAWDWQCSFGKSTNERTKSQACNSDTPKRTKLLQKKRNPNSPLLQKPLKRKQVKMENIEDIGKFAAELKALSEKMTNIRQNCESHEIKKECDLKSEPDTQLVVELKTENEGETMSEVFIKEDEATCEVVAANANNQKGSSYEDLFDDSIEDCMVKCSQEIEEKLNLVQNKRNDFLGLSMVKEGSELSLVNVKNLQSSTICNNTTETSKNSNTSRNSSTNNMSSYLKTYSKNSSKTNSTSSMHTSNSKEQTLQKSYLNNNVITSHNENACSKKLEGTNSGLFEIPDDSFDDCLATCLEDAKFSSKPFDVDNVFSEANQNAKTFDKMYKQSSPASTGHKDGPHKFVPKTLPFSYNDKPSSHDSSRIPDCNFSKNNKSPLTKEPSETSSASAMENRKFFKTKSLSDHFRGLGRNSSASNNVSKSSTSAHNSTNSVLSSESHVKSGSPFVSKTFPVVTSHKPSQSEHSSSNNSVENTHAPNRSVGKEGGTRITKYKSASDIRDPKETGRDSQPAQCTPQEIERKRLEAKMRLEAKRKLQQARVASATSEVPVKRPVMR